LKSRAIIGESREPLCLADFLSRTKVPYRHYRSLSTLIFGALEKDLRPDLEEGFSTGRIAPASVANMTSRDLATAATLEEIKKLEAQSFKATVRYEDEYVPVRYTKKALEDADALQAITEGIAGNARRERGEDIAEPEKTSEEEHRRKEEDEEKVPGAIQEEDERDEKDREQDGQDTVEPSESALTTAAPLPEAPRPTPQLVQTQQRHSSFSLHSVLGHVPIAPIETPPLEDEGDDEGLGGFNDGFVDENMGSDHGSDIDYSGRQEKKSEKIVSPVEPATKTILADIPVVWSGTVSNCSLLEFKRCALRSFDSSYSLRIRLPRKMVILESRLVKWEVSMSE
jgi:hypothetical protein